MLTRNCPSCGKLLTYKTTFNRNAAEKKGAICRSCCDKKPRSAESRAKMSAAHMGEKNHFFGKTHTEESLVKISKASKERNELYGNAFANKTHSEESKQRMSESRSAGIANGTIPNTNGYGSKSWYDSTKTGEHIYCDSILEKFRMTQIDGYEDITYWTKRHGIKIPYVAADNVVRNYIPDFLIRYGDGSILIEEVKGHDVDAPLKLAAIDGYCKEHDLTYRWIEQVELEKQGYRQFVKQENKRKRESESK